MYRDRDEFCEKCLFAAVVLTMVFVLAALWYNAASVPPTVRSDTTVEVDGQRPVHVVYYYYPWYHPWGWWYSPYPCYCGGSYHSYHTVVHHYHTGTHFYGSPRASAPAKVAPKSGVYTGKSSGLFKGRGVTTGKSSSFKSSGFRSSGFRVGRR